MKNTMKKGFLFLVLAVLTAGGVFAQRVGDTVQVSGSNWTVQSVSGDTMTLRKGPTLDGVWTDGSRVVNISGKTGIFTEFVNPRGLTQDGIKNGHYKIGGQYLRNLTKTGDLTWTGQELSIPRSGEGIWVDGTFTLSVDGKTFIMRTTTGTVNYRKQ
jgi:hypothetical protein